MKQTSKLSFKEQSIEEIEPMKPIYDQIESYYNFIAGL